MRLRLPLRFVDLRHHLHKDFLLVPSFHKPLHQLTIVLSRHKLSLRLYQRVLKFRLLHLPVVQWYHVRQEPEHLKKVPLLELRLNQLI